MAERDAQAVIAAALFLISTAAPAAGIAGTAKERRSDAEVILNEVCLRAIVERKPVEELASELKMIAMPPSSVGATAADKVWRKGMMVPVYVVAWADGGCSTYVERGNPGELRELAVSAISLRAEGFTQGSDMQLPEQKVRRTVYCATSEKQQLVATIATPEVGARSRRPLSSTVYRRASSSPLCSPEKR